MNKKKPRALMIGIDFARARGVTISPDGSIRISGREGHALEPGGEVGLSYAKKQGRKTTVKLFDCPGRFATPIAAVPKFERVVGIDTNLDLLNGERVATSTAAEIRNYSFSPDGWSATFQPLWCVEFHGLSVDAERFGWHCALAMFSAAGLLMPAPTLFVVDSHLGDLQKIARRESPVWESELLPEGVCLAYASSDTQNDSPLNRLMHVCDAVSRERFRLTVADSKAPPLEKGPPGAPYRGFRYWAIDPALPH